MLEIKPYVDKQTLSAYCREAGKPVNEAFYLYLATDKEETLAACLFEVESDSVHAVYYKAADEGDCFMLDALLRAGFHYAEQYGIENGEISEEFRFAHRAAFSKLNFPLQPTFNITNFFLKYKNCKRNPG